MIDVRDMREIEPFVIPETGMAEGFNHIALCERSAEKVAGVNDIASGQVSQESRTLGEVQMATEQAFVRMDAIIRRFQEFMEDLGQVRLAIWKRCLAEQPDGVEAPQSLLVGLEGRGVSIDQYLPEKKITAQLLDGAFRFKPNGSVETADKTRLRADFTNALAMLPRLVQTFPSLIPMLQSPQAARSMMRHFLQLWNIPNQQAFLGSPAQDLLQTQQMAMLPAGMPMQPNPMMGGQPGMPPGMPGQPTPPGMAPGGSPQGGNPIQMLAAKLAATHGMPPPGLVPGPTQPQ